MAEIATAWRRIDGSLDAFFAASAFGCPVEFWCEEHAPALHERLTFEATHYRDRCDGYDYRLKDGAKLRVIGEWCCCGFKVHNVTEIQETEEASRG